MSRFLAALLFLVVLNAMSFAQWVVTPRTDLNPDQAGIVSDDPAAGASLVTIVGPLPAPTSHLILRIGSALGGQIDITRVVVSGDTPASVAQYFCDEINNNATLASVHVRCQLSVPGVATFFGVTHHVNNVLVLTAMTAPNVLQIHNGTLAWEAGPVLYLNRSAGPGQVPPPGSNCGYFPFNAPNSATPGMVSTTYVLITCTVVNSDANNLSGQIDIFTAKTINGAWLLERKATFSTTNFDIAGMCADANGYFHRC